MTITKKECEKRKSDLRGANLRGADLREADLHEADLCRANLCGANLYKANLYKADLCRAELRGANLYGAMLDKTVIYSNNTPNMAVVGFERLPGGYVYGYRNRKSEHFDQYRDGRIYAADWFSTCSTECHPGLYLWPTVQEAIAWDSNAEIIQVKTKAVDIHKAGNKWRCRWFEVIGTVQKADIK